MKQKINNVFKGKLLAAMMITVIFAGCQKGDTGPAGPQGPQGNANVGVGTVSVTQSQWTYDNINWDYYYDVSDNSITEAIATNGTVEVFVNNTGATDDWNAMPYTVYYLANKSYSFDYEYYNGGVTLYIKLSDNSTFSTIATYSFKVVVISGSLRKANPNANWSNYNETMAIINANKVAPTGAKLIQ